MTEGNLVEPEGVNAGSREAMRDTGGSGDSGDLVAGGEPERARDQQAAEPAELLTGPPPEPAGNSDAVYGSEPPA